MRAAAIAPFPYPQSASYVGFLGLKALTLWSDLFTKMTPRAPAASALIAFCTNVHAPRLITTTLPRTCGRTSFLGRMSAPFSSLPCPPGCS